MTSPPEQFELESLHTAVEITPQLRPWESVIIVAAPFKSWSSHRKLKLFVASVGLKVADCRVRHGSYLPRNGRDSAGSWGVAPRDFADGRGHAGKRDFQSELRADHSRVLITLR